MKTTLNKIRAYSPCEDGWKKLLKNLGKAQADDEPLELATVLESNGLDDALWCLRTVEGHEKEMRLFAVECARSVQHLMKDQRSIDAIDVAERYAHGTATNAELSAAGAAAESAADSAVRDAVRDAAWTSAGAAALDSAWSTVGVSAWVSAGGASRAAERAAAWASSGASSGDAAWAAKDAQSILFLLLCEGALK